MHTHQIKLETNQDAISFEKIYKNIPNLVLMNDNALGFRYTSGVRVGIKGDRTGGSSGRYFISSDNLEAIWPIICDLKERLCIVFPSPELHVFYLDELPVSALNRLVEEYITVKYYNCF